KLGGFASHGCVGLTDSQAIDFSKRLAALGGVEITDRQIAKYRQNRSTTKNIALQHPIPIELRYETIVVQYGMLYSYHDVYGRETKAEENLRNDLRLNGLTLEKLSENERSKPVAALNQRGRSAVENSCPPAPPQQFITAATGRPPVATPSKRWK